MSFIVIQSHGTNPDIKLSGTIGNHENTERIQKVIKDAQALSDVQLSQLSLTLDHDDYHAANDCFFQIQSRKIVPPLMHLLQTSPLPKIRHQVLQCKYIYTITKPSDVHEFYNALATRCSGKERRFAIRNIGRWGSKEIVTYCEGEYRRSFDAKEWNHPSHMQQPWTELFDDWLAKLKQAVQDAHIDDFLKNPDNTQRSIQEHPLSHFHNIDAIIPQDCPSTEWYKFAFSRRRVLISIIRGHFPASSSLNLNNILSTVDVPLIKKTFINNTTIWKQHLTQNQRLFIVQHPRFESSKKELVRNIRPWETLKPEHAQQLYKALWKPAIESKDYIFGSYLYCKDVAMFSIPDRQYFKDLMTGTDDSQDDNIWRPVEQPVARQAYEHALFTPDIGKILDLAHIQQNREHRRYILYFCGITVMSSENLTIFLDSLTTRWRNERDEIRQENYQELRKVDKKYWEIGHTEYLKTAYENEIRLCRDRWTRRAMVSLLVHVMLIPKMFGEMLKVFTYAWDELRDEWLTPLHRKRHPILTVELSSEQKKQLFRMIEEEILSTIPEEEKREGGMSYPEVLREQMEEQKLTYLYGLYPDMMEYMPQLRRRIAAFAGHDMEHKLLDICYSIGMDVSYARALEVYLHSDKTTVCTALEVQLNQSLRFPSAAFIEHIMSISTSDKVKQNIANLVTKLPPNAFTHWSQHLQSWYLSSVSNTVNTAYMLPSFDLNTYNNKISQSISAAQARNDKHMRDNPSAATKLIRANARRLLSRTFNPKLFEKLLEEEILSGDKQMSISIYLGLLNKLPVVEAAERCKPLLDTKLGISVAKQLLRYMASISSVPSFLAYIDSYRPQITHRDIKDTILAELLNLTHRKICTKNIFSTWKMVFDIEVPEWSWETQFPSTVVKHFEEKVQKAYIRVFLERYLASTCIKRHIYDEGILQRFHQIDDILAQFPQLLPEDMVRQCQEDFSRLISTATQTKWEDGTNTLYMENCLDIVQAYSVARTTNDEWIDTYIQDLQNVYPTVSIVSTKTERARSEMFKEQLERMAYIMREMPLGHHYGVKVTEDELERKKEKSGRMKQRHVRDVLFLNTLEEQVLWPLDRSRRGVDVLQYFAVKMRLSNMRIWMESRTEGDVVSKLLSLRTWLYNIIHPDDVESFASRDNFDDFFLKHGGSVLLFSKHYSWEHIIDAIPQSEMVFRVRTLIAVAKRMNRAEEQKEAREQVLGRLQKEFVEHGVRAGVILEGEGYLSETTIYW